MSGTAMLWPLLAVASLLLAIALAVVLRLRRRLRDQEAELRESAERLDLAADSAGAGLWSVEMASRRVWGNTRMRELLGLQPGAELTYELLSAAITLDLGTPQGADEDVEPGNGRLAAELRVTAEDGSQRWISLRGQRHVDACGRTERLVGVGLDISERRRVEEAARDLSQRLIRAHEDEHARLARDLHDDVTQRLALLAIEVGRAERRPDEAAASMRSVREGLVRLSEDIHTLSYRLHPSVLDDLGLVEALRAECERFSRHESVPALVRVDPLPRSVPSDVALCLFRITQEGLRNVARHAGARAVRVSLRNLEGGLQLAIHDDGSGFDVIEQSQRRSLGLASMRERLSLLRGRLEVESAPGHGTTIVAWVPVRQAAA